MPNIEVGQVVNWKYRSDGADLTVTGIVSSVIPKNEPIHRYVTNEELALCNIVPVRTSYGRALVDTNDGLRVVATTRLKNNQSRLIDKQPITSHGSPTSKGSAESRTSDPT